MNNLKYHQRVKFVSIHLMPAPLSKLLEHFEHIGRGLRILIVIIQLLKFKM